MSRFLKLNSVGYKGLIRTADGTKHLTFTKHYAHYLFVTSEALLQDQNAQERKDFSLPGLTGDVAARAALRKKGACSCSPKSPSTPGVSFRAKRSKPGVDFSNSPGIAEHSARLSEPPLMFLAPTPGLTGANT
jgi:hypothetical protein